MTPPYTNSSSTVSENRGRKTRLKGDSLTAFEHAILSYAKQKQGAVHLNCALFLFYVANEVALLRATYC